VCARDGVSEILLAELDVRRVEPKRADEVRHEPVRGLVGSRPEPGLEPSDEPLHRRVTADDRERGRFNHRERPHQVPTACRSKKTEHSAIGVADQICAAAQDGDQITDLGVEIEPHRRRAIAVPAPGHQQDPVPVGQLPLIRKGLLGAVEAAVDEHDRLALADLDDVQIGPIRAPEPGRQSELKAPNPGRT
jgi:hypothetical protein